jgi:hypothetical protein
MMLPLDPSRLSFSLVGKEIKQTYDGRSGKMLTEIVFPTWSMKSCWSWPQSLQRQKLARISNEKARHIYSCPPIPAPWLPPLNLCLQVKKNWWWKTVKSSSISFSISRKLVLFRSSKKPVRSGKYSCLLLARVMVADIRWNGGGGESGGWYAPEEGWDGQAVRCLYSIAWWVCVCVSPEKRDVMNR